MRLLLFLAQCAFGFSLRHTLRLSASSESFAFDGSGVRMARDAWGGSGLVSTRAFKAGDTLCTIPLSMCLLARRDGVICTGLKGQSDAVWDVAGDLREPIAESDEKLVTWDLRLAFALLEATAGSSLATAGSFWDNYTGALPQPASLTLPFCFSDVCLEETHDEELVARAKNQKARLSNFAVLDVPGWHRCAMDSGALTWAFALVRSRCFALAPDYFAVVPIIDIANHSPAPNSEFLVVGSSLENGACIIRARQDIALETPILIEYDAQADTQYDNRRLFTQYGFTLSGNGASSSHQEDFKSDEQIIAPGSDKAAVIDWLVDAVIVLDVERERAQSAAIELGRRIRAQPADSSAAQIVSSLRGDLLAELAAIEQRFTSFEADSILLNTLNAGQSTWVNRATGEDCEPSDPFALNRLQFAAAVRYRLEPKADLRVSLTLLQALADHGKFVIED